MTRNPVPRVGRRIASRALVVSAIAMCVVSLNVVSADQASAKDPTGTAMVRTQRMSDATLKSTQHGWYEKDIVISLVCYKRGQAVWGYFSFNVGWDDLWYLASDGYYVADVDIETHSTDPITGACPPPPPPPPPPPAVETAPPPPPPPPADTAPPPPPPADTALPPVDTTPPATLPQTPAPKPTITPAVKGTAMVRTQRQTEATLLSPQDGWYEKGATLTLVCYVRGQAVRGYFSNYFNMDNLWYQVSDKRYVADVDIETGSANPVTAACPTPLSKPPTDLSARATAAITWAKSMDGSDAYPGGCLRFVANAYGSSTAGYTSAMSMQAALSAAGKIHFPGTSAPTGALVFTSSSADNGNGHVALALGNGRYAQAGVLTGWWGGKTHHTVEIASKPNLSTKWTDLGWAYPPSRWPGR